MCSILRVEKIVCNSFHFPFGSWTTCYKKQEFLLLKLLPFLFNIPLGADKVTTNEKAAQHWYTPFTYDVLAFCKNKKKQGYS